MKTLPSGIRYSYGANGERICIGSHMGRRSSRIQSDLPVKVYLRRLKWVDGDYDEQGAYWGGGLGDHVYWANFDLDDPASPLSGTNEDIFVRAFSREEAKALVREQLPNARFFN